MLSRSNSTPQESELQNWLDQDQQGLRGDLAQFQAIPEGLYSSSSSEPPRSYQGAEVPSTSLLTSSMNETMSTRTPSLVTEGTTVTGSVETKNAGNITRVPTFDEHGFLNIPDMSDGSRVPCGLLYPFNCHEMCDRTNHVEHSLAHFEGHEPPNYLFCPYCALDEKGDFPNGWKAWECRLEHVLIHYARHYELRRALPAPRIDERLLKYLLKNRLIDLGRFTDLKSGPSMVRQMGICNTERSTSKHYHRK